MTSQLGGVSCAAAECTDNREVEPARSGKGNRVERNDLVSQLATDADDATVVVDVNGVLIDIEAVTTDRGSLVIVLNSEDVEDTLQKVASGRLPVRVTNTP